VITTTPVEFETKQLQFGIGSEKIRSLEALRGLAALGVAVYHWQNFRSVELGKFVYEAPFSLALLPFYKFGWILVDFFFLLSGFVFYFVYAGAIYDKRVNGRIFLVARFARLYPLHILTLVVVAALHSLYYHRFGTNFAYTHNDVTHFVLHMFMLADSPLAIGWSFNGPIWSVSIEVLLYGVFFLLARMTKPTFNLCLAIVVMGLGLYVLGLNHLSRGVMSFFLGGMVFFLVDRVRRSVKAFRVARLALVMAIGLGTVIAIELWLDGWEWLLKALDLAILNPTEASNRLRSVTCVFLLFPVALFAFALRDILGKGGGLILHSADWLGAISYSVYLWHIPIQILIALVAGPHVDFRNPQLFLTYLAIVVTVSTVSFRYFEDPCRRLIGSKLSIGVQPRRPLLHTSADHRSATSIARITGLSSLLKRPLSTLKSLGSVAAGRRRP
jgi:peptidoglycan/LPS O-acetylase OafA/YrhL